MASDLKTFDDLVAAAACLTASRENNDDTSEEWNDLNHALLAATERPADGEHPRWGFEDGRLMRWSRLASGALEDHACYQPDFEATRASDRGVDDAPAAAIPEARRTSAPSAAQP